MLMSKEKVFCILFILSCCVSSFVVTAEEEKAKTENQEKNKSESLPPADDSIQKRVDVDGGKEEKDTEPRTARQIVPTAEGIRSTRQITYFSPSQLESLAKVAGRRSPPALALRQGPGRQRNRLQGRNLLQGQQQVQNYPPTSGPQNGYHQQNGGFDVGQSQGLLPALSAGVTPNDLMKQERDEQYASRTAADVAETYVPPRNNDWSNDPPIITTPDEPNGNSIAGNGGFMEKRSYNNGGTHSFGDRSSGVGQQNSNGIHRFPDHHQRNDRNGEQNFGNRFPTTEKGHGGGGQHFGDYSYSIGEANTKNGLQNFGGGFPTGPNGNGIQSFNTVVDQANSAHGNKGLGNNYNSGIANSGRNFISDPTGPGNTGQTFIDGKNSGSSVGTFPTGTGNGNYAQGFANGQDNINAGTFPSAEGNGHYVNGQANANGGAFVTGQGIGNDGSGQGFVNGQVNGNGAALLSGQGNDNGDTSGQNYNTGIGGVLTGRGDIRGDRGFGRTFPNINPPGQNNYDGAQGFGNTLTTGGGSYAGNHAGPSDVGVASQGLGVNGQNALLQLLGRFLRTGQVNFGIQLPVAKAAGKGNPIYFITQNFYNVPSPTSHESCSGSSEEGHSINKSYQFRKPIPTTATFRPFVDSVDFKRSKDSTRSRHRYNFLMPSSTTKQIKVGTKYSVSKMSPAAGY